MLSAGVQVRARTPRDRDAFSLPLRSSPFPVPRTGVSEPQERQPKKRAGRVVFTTVASRDEYACAGRHSAARAPLPTPKKRLETDETAEDSTPVVGIQRVYAAALLRRSFCTNQPLAECNKAFEKFKLKQAKMQV
ncbi:PREDICTED: uncharacterized protein LOC105560243 [Vollenhovia emeryi]|uniref:uncharacterized protein LOC105560243 n=1 Tax=Vollenhovia emeryi TaxID=411798 RepID=UPI0005F45993|nr:PREDICTED: uncharacterized protein LOC105560243 [Vollenhovia emeryi]